MQVTSRQPQDAMVGTLYDTRSGDKSVQRALCMPVVGKSQDSFVWLEKSLDKFAISKSTKATKTSSSIIIVDDSSRNALQRFVSGNSTLYQRLADRNVRFVSSKAIMKFVHKKYGANPIPEWLRNLRELSFANSEKISLDSLLRANILKLLCPDYAFSRDKRLHRLAVVDADSLIPIQPTTPSAVRSAVFINLRMMFQLDTVDGCTFRTPVPGIYADSEFILTLLKRLGTDLRVSEFIHSFSFSSGLHQSFNEFGSRALAEALTRDVIRIINHLQGLPWLAMAGDTAKKFLARGRHLAEGDQFIGAAVGVKNLAHGQVRPAEVVCFQHCYDLQRADILTCPVAMGCALNLYELQSIMSGLVLEPLLRIALQSLVDDIDKLSATATIHLCCGTGAKLATPEICRKALDHNQCLQSVRSSREFSIIPLIGVDNEKDYNYDVLFHQNVTDKLLTLFSSPLQDWEFQATEANFRIFQNSPGNPAPRTTLALGKEHADMLLGNATAFFQLDPSWQLDCTDRQKSASPQDFSPFDQSRMGFRYGAVAGLMDELFSFTPLPTQYTWLYNSGRGFLFGGNVGLALGLGEHVYLQYIEPIVPDGSAKAFVRSVVSKSFLAAAVVQGGLFNALGSVAGYTFTRNAAQVVRSFWTHTRQNVPDNV